MQIYGQYPYNRIILLVSVLKMNSNMIEVYFIALVTTDILSTFTLLVIKVGRCWLMKELRFSDRGEGGDKVVGVLYFYLGSNDNCARGTYSHNT